MIWTLEMWTLRALNTDWAWPGHQDQISAALSVTHSLYVSLWLSLTTISKIIKPVACQYYQSFIINDKYRVFIICGTYLQCILQCMNPGEWCQYVETGQLITHMRVRPVSWFCGSPEQHQTPVLLTSDHENIFINNNSLYQRLSVLFFCFSQQQLRLTNNNLH